jgi:AraC-like DNA-binding protein
MQQLRCDTAGHATLQDWLDQVVMASQRLAGRVAFVQRDDARRLLTEFVRSLPSPETQIEWIVMRGLLMEVAYRSSSVLHDRVHGGKPTQCEFVCATLLDGFYRNTTANLVDTFLMWLDTFLTELDHTHPPSIAARVSDLIKREYTRPWTLATLTRRFGVSSTQLREAFRKEFGVSIPRYQLTMRIVSAIDDLRDAKMDAVAFTAGYRSKKNFYRAFNRLTGLTVSEFRKLPLDRARDIQETAKLRLVRKTPVS